MIRVSTKSAALLILLSFFYITAYGQDADWPLKTRIDLSSGFGDFRLGRFHAGIDLRTGGIVGRKVFSPVDGYVWRVSMSYDGYGKGLYIMADDGHLYVFGHLSALAERINRAVQKAQNRAERYYVDLYFPRDSIPVARGEMIALSGQTGVGAPHLHFEERAPDNRPINPLSHGFSLKDRVRPVFRRIGFELCDDRSLFVEGGRKRFYEITAQKKAGRFALDSVVYMNAPFGVLVDCFDRMRPRGMRQSIYRLTFSVENEVLYQVILDTLDFEAGPASALAFDAAEIAAGRKRVRRLYRRTGNTCPGQEVNGDSGGIFGLDPDLPYGLYRAKIVGEDNAGNSSELTFRFLWGPSGNIYRLDTVVTVDSTTRDFFFVAVPGYEKLDVRAVELMAYREDGWQMQTGARVSYLANGWIKVRVAGINTDKQSLRLRLRAGEDCSISEEPFCLGTGRGNGSGLAYEIAEDGLIVTATMAAHEHVPATVRFCFRDSLLAEEPLRVSGEPGIFRLFLRPRPELRRIDRLVMMTGETPPDTVGLDVAIAALGYDKHEVFAADNAFAIECGRENFFEPRFVAVERRPPPGGFGGQLNSPVYKILPEGFAVRRAFDLDLELNPAGAYNSRSGLGWWDEEGKSWVWLDDDSTVAGHVRGSTMGGGEFAAVYDIESPRIEKLNIKSGQTIREVRPEITFMLIDTLAGFGDDRDIDVRVNGQWLIPEYDRETYECKATPFEPLPTGECRLTIIATDRAGNRAEHSVVFNVSETR